MATIPGLLWASLILLFGTPCAEAHRPHLDDGTHTSISNAWEWPDLIYARIFMTTQQCPSLSVYTKVAVNDPSKPLAVSLGIPNITSINNYRPSLWFIGKTVVTPEGYQTDLGRRHQGPSAHRTGFQPDVPPGFNAVEYSSEGSDLWTEWGESDLTTGHVVLSADVTVSAPGDVYVVLQPTENRQARSWLAIDGDETEDPNEPGLTSDIDLYAWYSPTSTPLLGSECQPWGPNQHQGGPHQGGPNQGGPNQGGPNRGGPNHGWEPPHRSTYQG